MIRRTADWSRSAVESESEVAWTFIRAVRRLPIVAAHRLKTVDYEPDLSSSNALFEALTCVFTIAIVGRGILSMRATSAFAL